MAKHHRPAAQLAVADGRQEVVHGGELEVPGQLQQALLLERGERGLAQTPELLVQHLPALADVLLAALLLEPLPDLLPGSGRLHEVEPIPRRPVRRLGGEDLHDVAVHEAVVEGDHPAVDLGPDAVMADRGVDPVGEVDGGAPRRQ